VRHALFALSSLHEALSSGCLIPSRDASGEEFAILEYNKAISCLLRPADGATQKEDLIPMHLIVCILFVCIEFMLGHEGASLTHIDQGRHILSQLDRNNTSSVHLDLIRRFLVPIYTRLAITSHTFGANPCPIPDFLKVADAIPGKFESIEEARYFLHDISDAGLRFSRKTRGIALGLILDKSYIQEFAAEQQQLLSRLVAWDVALSMYLAGRPGRRKGPSHSEQMLRVYYQVAYIWISNSLSSYESTYDDYLDRFTSIISLASSLTHPKPISAEMPQAPQSNASSPPSPSTASVHSSESQSSSKPRSIPLDRNAFSFENQIIPPLFYTIIKCRHPHVRRAALELLTHPDHRYENLWDPRFVVPAVVRMIDLEETAGREAMLKDEAIVQEAQQVESPTKAESRSPAGQLPAILECPDPREWMEEGGFSIFRRATSRKFPKTFDSALPEDPSLIPPYNVPEHVRIRNSFTGPKQQDGIWLTVFRKLDGISGEWNVLKEFLEC
jgi:hypothetical protein